MIFGKTAVRSFVEDYVATVGHETSFGGLSDAGAAVVVRLSALSGGLSGVEGDQEYTNVVTLRKAGSCCSNTFWDHQEALEAAGLRE